MTPGKTAARPETAPRHTRFVIRGTVQGVGFRPFLYRLARKLELRGEVHNDDAGVIIDVFGPSDQVDRFARELQSRPPGSARIDQVEATELPPPAFPPEQFLIGESAPGEAVRLSIPPDLALCPDCAQELRDPGNRRHRHPFINCTQCGPRFSIVLSLPYDRPRTTMRDFPLCPDCEREFHDPGDRRFHAQPIACPACGPRLELLDASGRSRALREAALGEAVDAILAGRIVALKGLGGFHLVCDAANDAAVQQLRERKRREEKPFALMAPSLRAVRALCHLTPMEEALLEDAAAPIVLLPRRAGAPVADAVAPGNPRLGVLLPYTPLHLLMLEQIARPVVATSGNLSDEPICTDEREAVRRLRGIADLFLVHNRPIARPVDDSIVQVVDSRFMLLRRARGYAPAPVRLPVCPGRVFAVGAHLKSTVAVAQGTEVVLSQHLGDLSTAAAFDSFAEAGRLLRQLLRAEPEVVVCDLHPDYASTRQAEALCLPHPDGASASRTLLRVQHHHAHVLAVLGEHGVADQPALGIAWDGTGLGTDGTIWGGEFLEVDGLAYKRFATLRPFPLPGGEAAMGDPRRSALGLLWLSLGTKLKARHDLRELLSYPVLEWENLLRLLERGLNTPSTSSMGRLFDAVAALAGVCLRSSFEGHAAMRLEFALPPEPGEDAYALGLRPAEPSTSRRADAAHRELDWEPMLHQILADRQQARPSAEIAQKFHHALVAAAVAIGRDCGRPRVALSGGCFQNQYLLAQCRRQLTRAGFEVLLPRQLPVNDGAIAYGQAVAAALALAGAPKH